MAKKNERFYAAARAGHRHQRLGLRVIEPRASTRTRSARFTAAGNGIIGALTKT